MLRFFAKYLQILLFYINNIYIKYIKRLDYITLFYVVLLITFGFITLLSVSPAISARIGASKYHFAQKQIIFIIISLTLIIFTANANIENILKNANLLFLLLTLLLVLTLITGTDIKNAKRWINLGFLSLQPSEIMKPFFVIINAKILHNLNSLNMREKILKSCCITGIIAVLLILEPDFGMMLVFTATSSVQMFVAGVPLRIMANLFIMLLLSCLIIFTALPHVRYRIMNFTGSDDKELNYQVKKSKQSIKEGGLFGKGPGNGSVKYQLPDSHTDYIFSVICEEFGYFIALIMILIYLMLIIRNLTLILKITNNKINILIMYGLVFIVTMQVFVNIGVNLNILPSKGMTLPLISYGGSAIMAMGIIFGIMLNLTKNMYRLNSPYKKVFNLF